METKKNKSNYLIQGTILAGASIIARIIGMIYRIPLTNILGDEGNAYYATANQIYSILLMISTFSLPLAVSKLISERIHRGETKNAQRVLGCALRFAAISGGIMAALTFLLAGVVCGTIMRVDGATIALRVISPAIFIFAIAGVFRGYFQGFENMVPTATSQIIEQVINAFVSVLAASAMYKLGSSVMEGQSATSMAAAGATSGTVVSVTIALLFLLFVYGAFRKDVKRNLAHDVGAKKESDSHIYQAIILTVVPVIFSTLVYNISPTLDQAIFNAVLSGQGYTAEQYNTIYGIYTGKFYVLMNVPLALASCLAPSVVPALTAAVVERDYKDARIKVRTTMRYTMIITIPCAVGMAVLASPIMQLLFHDTHRLSAGIMQSGALMIVFFAVSTLYTAVLQGLGRMKDPLINSCIALAVHVILLLVLLKQFRLNIYAVVYANTAFALIVCILNFRAIRRRLRYRQEIRRTFLIPLISAALMGLAVFLVYQGIDRLLLLALSDYIANFFATVVSILVGILVYTFFLVRLRGIRSKEIQSLPKGALLVRILTKMHFLA
ncbi:MAG: polysaccharide biosynthesis protein [Eubacteriales bacterium]|nr:polysaccharide biosynthesis protein [Eubacteriales bacterium]